MVKIPKETNLGAIAYRFLSILLVLTLLPSMLGCKREEADDSARLTIAAAASLRYVMNDLVAGFEADYVAENDGKPVEVRVSYGSSGNFYAQLRQRAPFDVFFSADTAYAAGLSEAGIALDGEIFEYARGRLVIWVGDDSLLNLEEDIWRQLDGKRVRRIAISSPEHTPYGRAAVAALEGSGIYEAIEGKLVYGENIAQAAHFVESGAADVGLLALSLARSPAMQGKGRYVEVSDALYPPIVQSGLIMHWTEERALATRFRDFVLGEEGRAILSGYGFGLP